MSIPNIPEFLKIAQMLNGMVPELSAIIKPAIPIFKAAKDSAGFSRNLTNVAKRANFIEGEFALNKGQPGRVATVLKKSADEAKKVADATKKVQDAFYEKAPGGANQKNASAAGGQLLGIVLQGGLALAIIHNTLVQNFINDTVDRQFITLNNDLSKNLTLLTTLNSRVKNLDIKVNDFNTKINRELDVNARDYAQLNKQTETIAKNAVDAKKQSNDALYETRQGRTILESKIAESKKQSNDALYEIRTTKQNVEKQITGVRASLEAKIQQVNSQISKFNNSANEAFQKAISTTVSKVQSDLAITKSQVNAIKQTDTASITANAVAAAKAIVTPLQSAVEALSNQTNGIATLASVAIKGVSNLAQAVSTANNTASNAQQESESTRKYVERTLVPRIEATVTQSTGVTAEIAKLQGETQNTRTYVERTLVPRIEATVTQSTGVAAEVAEVKQQIPALSTQVKQSQIQISDLNKKLTEQEKVNQQALPKLEQIVGILGLIPARAAAAIRPDIPTIPQIEAAAATGTCRTTQPGGCMNKALKDNAADIANNNNTNSANILDAVNTGLNGALLTGQQTILARLGDQLPGGIGGKLSRFADWMHLDRVLNILIAGATIHNGLMLSNDIGQTFIGILNNVLQLIGLKKEDGSAFDIGSVISGSIENLIKGAIGTENYANLTTAWAKANRIYQASTNILNSFQSLTSTILSGLELVAGQTGKIGNALRASGEVLESAYQWMNPQPKINRVTNFLEKLQNGASTIQQVTQVPLDTINAITELQTANTEFIKAIKEDDKPENKGAAVDEPAKLAESKELAKQLSKGIELIGIDLEADD